MKTNKCQKLSSCLQRKKLNLQPEKISSLRNPMRKLDNKEFTDYWTICDCYTADPYGYSDCFC